ncbi:MAG: universal stress protein [Archangium sp.]
MKILCGDDFSEAAERALNAAAALARDGGHSLELVHTLEFPFSADAAAREHLMAATTRELERRAAAVGASTRVVLGSVEQGLIQAARETGADLVVVGATGAGKRRGAGSHADALVRAAQVPVLVVRDDRPFLSWTRDERSLEALVGLERDGSGTSAWRFAQALFGRHRTRWSGAHFYFPPDEQKRVGLEGPHSAIDPDAVVEGVLRRELLARYPGLGDSIELAPTIGRASDRLVASAAAHESDVVIIGSHRRSAIERLWFGSVSRHVLHDAPCSVLCVPRSADDSRVDVTAASALVAVDASWIARRVVENACALLPPSFTVHLLRVVAPAQRLTMFDERDVFAHTHPGVEEQLRQLVPASRRNVEVAVAESRDAPLAILQAAERFGAGVIILGLRSSALGETARDVVAAARVPTLLVPGTGA